MREILFRGKRIDNGEWVEGCPLKSWGRTRIIWESTKMEEESSNAREVDPATVGQYTGLTDKNDVKIFEGDIVNGNVFGDIWVGVIVWIEFIAGFGVRYSHREDPTAWENSSMLRLLTRYKMDEFAAEVIGNIHDKPELLQEGERHGTD